MWNAVKPLRAPVFTAILACLPLSLGCHAQVSTAQLSPELHRRVEVLIRSKLNVPPNYIIAIGPREKTDIPGYSSVDVTFAADGKTTKPVAFLLSDDGNTLAQFNKFDLSKDLSKVVSPDGRPARGGPASAPVVIVGFDDLECPYCAKMNAQIFPAMLDRYKDKVRIVYRDFPLSQHPWAMRASVDVNCLATQSPAGYWKLVDYIHDHAPEFGGADKALDKAHTELDKLTREEGARQHVDLPALDACIQKQDHTAIDASLKLGESLGIEATPVLFINGEKLEGAYPVEDVFRMIDGALIAAGQTPPPAPVVPAPEVAPEMKAPAPTPKPGT